MLAIELGKNDRILIIAPHPDDECIGAGGVLLDHAAQCDVLVLTDGRQGQGDVPPEEGKRIRRQEFIEEMDFLGVHAHKMLDIEDGTLLLHQDCLMDERICDYDVLFVTSLQDDHPDHKAAFLCVKKALEKVPAESRPRCFAYEVHSPLQQPTHFLDITGVIEQKQKLIRFHGSQLRDLPYDILAEQSAAYRATLFRMHGKRIEVYEEIDPCAEASLSETDALLQKERVTGWTLKRWIGQLLEDCAISDELKRRGVEEVYIYGYGDPGKLLLKDLRKGGIGVRGVIDRRAGQLTADDVDIIRLEDVAECLPVIVSVVFEYSEIEKRLTEMGFDEIISLKEILETGGTEQ